MKKILNGLGVFGSIILTICLSVLIFLYAVILNVKFVVSKNGMSNTFRKIDVVEILKTTEDGTVWEDFKQLGENLNLTENEFEQILNSNKVKEIVGGYIGEVINGAFNDIDVSLTKEKMEKFLSIAIEEYNNVSDIKISDTEKDKIINSFDEEMIENINEEFASINLKDTVEPDYVQYVELVDNILFGNYILYILCIIILLIILIALFRFSYYKWIPYVKTSLVISTILMMLLGTILFIAPLNDDLEIIMPLKNILSTNLFITSGVLFVLAIALTIGKIYLYKYIDSNKSDNAPEKVNEVKNNKKEKVKKEDKNKKDKIIFIIIILILLLIIIFLVFRRKSYTITFDTNGGSLITNIEVKDNEIVNLPEPPEKEGYTFNGWTNEEGKLITKGMKVESDITLKANWISNDAKTITLEFDVDGGSEVDNVLIEKGNSVLLPISPTKKGYVFVCWLDNNGNIVTQDIVLTSDITLKAMWIKKDAKISTVKFDTDGGSNIGSIVVENGKIILLPVNPEKEGYVFAGWVDENGNEITKDTIISKNITIKAIWKEPYTCPSGCTPIGDGSKCTKTTTKDLVTYTGCPSGTETVEKFCTSHQRQVSIGFGEDQFYETAGIKCDGNPVGYCVDYNNRYTIVGESCPSGYQRYIDSDGLGALYGCAKKYNKGGTSCPSGYTKNGNKCIKTETLKCKAN